MKPLLAIALLSSLAFSQATQFRGIGKLKGTITTSSAAATQSVHTYVLFPPASDPPGGKNNTNFRKYVMSQTGIDGVTVQVVWNSVETAHSSGSCGSNSDTCQKDSASQYHTYNWSTVDGTACAMGTPGTGLGQWFCTLTAAQGGWGAKSVNPLIFGISGNPNSATPAYVTSQGWADTVNSGGLQKVINKNKDICGSYSGYVPASMSMDMSGKVTVTMTGSVPFSNLDTIWIAGAEPTLPHDYNVTTLAGTTVSYSGGLTFTYQSSCVSPPSCFDASASPVGSIVSSASSWPIPLELPYEIAFRAFVAAAIYHFSHSGTVVHSNQVAYMRVGYARGGEALPECLSNWPGFVDQATSKQNWINFYADTSSFIMGASSSAAFHTQTSINEAGSPTATDYGTQEAAVSVQYSGGDGRVFGFGSQGLQTTDKTNAPTCGSDWCHQFERFWAGGSNYKYTEFELQQIDCSDPTAAATGLACAQNGSTSKTGDLRVLLPFALAEHMTILELYNQDALLAYDPKFCDTLSGGSCVSGGGSCTGTNGDIFSTLDTAHQNQFYQCVGQGATCSGAVGSGTGDCSYQATIDGVHGVH